MNASPAPTPPSREVLYGLLEAAIRAPSADNHHPFGFRIRGDTISLLEHPPWSSLGAQRRILAWIGVGAAIESLRVAATPFGIRAECRWSPEPGVLCEVALTADSTLAADPLVDALPRRCTNRRLFGGPQLDPIALAALQACAADNHGTRLIWLDDPDMRRQALHLIRSAESERFRSRALHQELFSSIRFDVSGVQTCSEGIPFGATEIEPPARPFFRLLRHWPVMRVANWFGGATMIGWRAGYLPARLSPHLAVIACPPGPSQEKAILAGAALLRAWAQATLLGLSLQPMAASALYTLPEFAGVSATVRGALVSGWRRLLGPQLQPWMVFRLGHAPPPTVVAGRPDLPSFILETSD